MLISDGLHQIYDMEFSSKQSKTKQNESRLRNRVGSNCLSRSPERCRCRCRSVPTLTSGISNLIGFKYIIWVGPHPGFSIRRLPDPITLPWRLIISKYLNPRNSHLIDPWWLKHTHKLPYKTTDTSRRCHIQHWNTQILVLLIITDQLSSWNLLSSFVCVTCGRSRSPNFKFSARALDRPCWCHSVFPTKCTNGSSAKNKATKLSEMRGLTHYLPSYYTPSRVLLGYDAESNSFRIVGISNHV
jgi:hypothetical protein